MAKQLDNDAIYARGLSALEDKLGPVETLRFLALITRQEFDYQRWRSEHFGEKTLNEVLQEARPFAQ